MILLHIFILHATVGASRQQGISLMKQSDTVVGHCVKQTLIHNIRGIIQEYADLDSMSYEDAREELFVHSNLYEGEKHV